MKDFDFYWLQSTGLNVGYASRGAGPLVLFLHGFPDTHRGFLPAMDAVAAAGYHAVAPEPRGYAPTDLPADGDYRVEAFANDVLGIADALGAQRFSLVGHRPPREPMTGSPPEAAAPEPRPRLGICAEGRSCTPDTEPCTGCT